MPDKKGQKSKKNINRQGIFANLEKTEAKIIIASICIATVITLLLLSKTWVLQHIIVLFIAYLIIALALNLDSKYPFGAAVILLIYSVVLFLLNRNDIITPVAFYGIYFLVIGFILDLTGVISDKVSIKIEIKEGLFEKQKKETKRKVKPNVDETRIMRYLLIASGKGGVGKTTIAANLAIAMSKLGINVTIMDMDIAMPDLEIITGLKNPPVGLMDVIENDLDIRKAMYVGHEGVKVIPSGVALEGFTSKNVKRVKSILKKMPYNIEVLILDMPPGVEAGKVMGSGYETLLVTTPETPSVLDALNMKIVAEKAGSKVIGLIVNRVKNEPGELDKKEIEETIETKVLAEIGEDENLKEALALEVPILVKYPNSKISKEIMKLAKSIGGAKVVRKERIISRFFSKLLQKAA